MNMTIVKNFLKPKIIVLYHVLTSRILLKRDLRHHKRDRYSFSRDRDGKHTNYIRSKYQNHDKYPHRGEYNDKGHHKRKIANKVKHYRDYNSSYSSDDDDNNSVSYRNYTSKNNDYYIASSSSHSYHYPNKRFRRRNPKFSLLPIEWWDRAEDCKDAKLAHVDRVDALCDYSREQLVLDTTLWKTDPALEPNMFPYLTPDGILHYTLWSRYDMSKEEIIHFVDNWLEDNMPQVRRWNYDDNLGERSIELFHVHVFIESVPFSFTPEEGKEYFPPHAEHSQH